MTDAVNHVIDKLSPSGQPLAQWLINPMESSAFPTLLAVAAQGDIYVADHTDKAILHLSTSGALLGTIGKGDFTDPYAVALGATGNLYATDFGGDRIREYSPSGAAVAVWGDGVNGTAPVHAPEAITIDGRGDMYVTEQSGHILKLDAAGRPLADWGGTASLTLNDPSGIALDAQDNIYVAEYEGERIDKLSPSGNVLARWR